MKQNTSNNGEQPICFRCKKRIGMLDFAKELIKAEDRRCPDCKIEEFRWQGYAKALTKILKRLRYRQTKIRNLWMATKLKEYEYAKMVLEEEIRIIEQELEEEKK